MGDCLCLCLHLSLDGLFALGRVGYLTAHGNRFEMFPLLLLYGQDHPSNIGCLLRGERHYILSGAKTWLLDNGSLFAAFLFLIFLYVRSPLLLYLFLRLYLTGPTACLSLSCKGIDSSAAALRKEELVIFFLI